MPKMKRGRTIPASVLDRPDANTLEPFWLALRSYQTEALEAVAESERRFGVSCSAEITVGVSSDLISAAMARGAAD